MPITVPTYYPQPWAANESLTPLTPEEMAAGYPSGTNEKPSRQSINNALQYAINGVLYYLTNGVPAWLVDALYETGAIISYGGSYFISLVDSNLGHQPDTAVTWWEKLPWRKSDLDALYMTQAQADARYLTPAAGDARYYTQAAAQALFLTISNAQAQYVTQAALDANYLTKSDADLLYMTQSEGDARYVLASEAVTDSELTQTLTGYVSESEAAENYMTQAAADERYMTQTEADTVYERQDHAALTYTKLVDNGMTIYASTIKYGYGQLALDKVSGIVYRSLTDNNHGNALSDVNYWQPWAVSAFDPNGLFLNVLKNTGNGDFTINASDVPLLATHPNGVYMKFDLQAAGGWGGWAAPVTTQPGCGGGEGSSLIAVALVKTTAFPLQIHLGYSMSPPTSHTTYDVASVTSNGVVVLSANCGQGGDSQYPGAGGTVNAANSTADFSIVSMTSRQGSDGRFGTKGSDGTLLRGGDGGGAGGGSGKPAPRDQNAATGSSCPFTGGGGSGTADTSGAQTHPGGGHYFIYF